MKKSIFLIIICLLFIISGCAKKDVEETKERDINKEFEGKNTLKCKAENIDKKGKEKYTTYIFEFDDKNEKIINKVGFEENIYVGLDTLDSKNFTDNKEWYKTTYCMYIDDCDIKVIADNRIKTAETFSVDNFDIVFLSKNKEEVKKGLEDGTLDPYSKPYTCE